MSLERLQKVMAAAGVASRRECEKLIEMGQVKVDGEVVTTPGTKVDPRYHRIEVNGRPLRLRPRIYLALNKPRGVVSSTVSQNDLPCVIDYVPREWREEVYPVGRLDVNTTGIILLTNDGEFANRIMHPRYEVQKIYIAKVRGNITSEVIEKLRTGVYLEDGKASVDNISIVQRGENATVLKLVLHEGRHHEVRRMLLAVGHPVKKLHRLAVGSVLVGSLKTGQCRLLGEEEVRALMRNEPHSERRLLKSMRAGAGKKHVGRNFKRRTEPQGPRPQPGAPRRNDARDEAAHGKPEQGREQRDQRRDFRGRKFDPSGGGRPKHNRPFGGKRDFRGAAEGGRPRQGKDAGAGGSWGDKARDDRGKKFGARSDDGRPKHGKSFGAKRGFRGSSDGGREQRGKGFGGKPRFGKRPRRDSD